MIVCAMKKRLVIMNVPSHIDPIMSKVFLILTFFITVFLNIETKSRALKIPPMLQNALKVWFKNKGIFTRGICCVAIIGSNESITKMETIDKAKRVEDKSRRGLILKRIFFFSGILFINTSVLVSKMSAILERVLISGSVFPFSQLETAWRVTESFSASSSWVMLFFFLMFLMFSPTEVIKIASFDDSII